MGEIAAVCVDDPMQVFAAFFGEWEAALFLVRIDRNTLSLRQSPQLHDNWAARL